MTAEEAKAMAIEFNKGPEELIERIRKAAAKGEFYIPVSGLKEWDVEWLRSRGYGITYASSGGHPGLASSISW